MKITALVFATGFGRRLYPLTAYKPKKLVCHKELSLRKHVVDKIICADIDDIVVHVHHFPDLIMDYFRQKASNIRLRISDTRAYRRDTGGRLKFAEPLLAQSDLWLLHKDKEIYTFIARRPIEFAFSGIHVMNRTVVKRIPNVEKYPVIPFYRQQHLHYPFTATPTQKRIEVR